MPNQKRRSLRCALKSPIQPGYLLLSWNTTGRPPEGVVVVWFGLYGQRPGCLVVVVVVVVVWFGGWYGQRFVVVCVVLVVRWYRWSS